MRNENNERPFSVVEFLGNSLTQINKKKTTNVHQIVLFGLSDPNSTI